MKLTNKLNLPEPIVRAVMNDPYDRGDSDITCTQLISPPRQVELRRLHEDDIEEDVSERIWALMGQAMHVVLERANVSGITERRLYTEVLGWKVSAQYDRLSLISGEGFEGLLIDWKTCSVWEYIHGIKKEREQQLNIQAELARRNGYKIGALQAGMIFRDWSKPKASREKGYPQRQVTMVDISLWANSIAQLYMFKRVREHQKALDDLPLCTDDERWMKPAKWAVMKEGRKSAVRVLDSEKEALVLVHTINVVKENHYIEHRPGEATRCLHYCSAAPFCEQFKKEQTDG